MPDLLEVTVGSISSAIEAQKGGADRIELCDNLFEGGTTPSIALIKKAREILRIPIHVIIRPRSGDFFYSEQEFEIMKEDILRAKELGINGVVWGILLPDGRIDLERNKILFDLASPLDTTFHRAFDMTYDPFEALTDIVSLGFDRILTSGQQNNALEGVELIKSLVQEAGDGIIIMPGSGINEGNILHIKEITGAREFHVSLRKNIDSKMTFHNELVSMGKSGLSEYQLSVTDADRVRKVKEILSS